MSAYKRSNTMPEESRHCRTCGALLNPEPDLRRQYRESQRDTTGKPGLQSAAVLGRFKCPGCRAWSEHPLWEVHLQGNSVEQVEADAPPSSGDEDV